MIGNLDKVVETRESSAKDDVVNRLLVQGRTLCNSKQSMMENVDQ